MIWCNDTRLVMQVLWSPTPRSKYWDDTLGILTPGSLNLTQLFRRVWHHSSCSCPLQYRVHPPEWNFDRCRSSPGAPRVRNNTLPFLCVPIRGQQPISHGKRPPWKPQIVHQDPKQPPASLPFPAAHSQPAQPERLVSSPWAAEARGVVTSTRRVTSCGGWCLRYYDKFRTSIRLRLGDHKW